MRNLLAQIATVLALAGVASANTVADDSQDTAAVGISSAATYRVTNNGPDKNIVAVARNAAGEITNWINIGHGDHKDIGVPQGGSLTIDDRDYSGSQTAPTATDDAGNDGAQYDYTTV